MSLKNTLVYCNTDNLYLHLYFSHIEGYILSIKIGNMKDVFKIELDEKESEDIKKQLEEL